MKQATLPRTGRTFLRLQKFPANATCSLLMALCVVAGGLAGCSKKVPDAGNPGQADTAKPEARARAATPVTITQAVSGAIETVETTLGTLEAIDDPRIAAEVAGRVSSLRVTSGQHVRKGQLLAEIDPADAVLLQTADAAEAARLRALLEQQERLVKRQSDLVARNFVARHALDDAKAQHDALKNQLAAVEARLALSTRNVGKTRVLAPADGSVDEVPVATGDYVKLGDPLLRLIARGGLRANLPFAETAATRLQRGQTVRLSAPALGDGTIESRIDDLRPQILEGSRSVIALVRLQPDERLRSGGSINASVVIGRRTGAVLVPEQAVVLRPAGTVVFLIEDGKALARPVATGAREGGKVEIMSGLKAGETVVLDGAGFLSGGFPVAVQEAKRPGDAGKSAATGQPAETAAPPRR